MTSQLRWTRPPAKQPKAGLSRADDEPGAAAMPQDERPAQPVGWLVRLVHAVFRSFRTAVQRRELAQLCDRQLRDTGIDPLFAGRGKAIAVDRTALLRLHSLSHGYLRFEEGATKECIHANLPSNADEIDIERWARKLRWQWFRRACRSALARAARHIAGAR